MKGKYDLIEIAATTYPVTELCAALGVSRSGYYRYLSRKGQVQNEEIREQIQSIYTQRNVVYGYRRIKEELFRQYKQRVNHKKVLGLMQELGLAAIIRRKRKRYSPYQVAQTDGRVAENLLKRDFTAAKPNQKWVTDVTQVRVSDQRLYLSAIKDLCGKDVVAYHMSMRNDNELVLETFAKAFEKHKDVTGLIVHSASELFFYFEKCLCSLGRMIWGKFFV